MNLFLLVSLLPGRSSRLPMTSMLEKESLRFGSRRAPKPAQTTDILAARDRFLRERSMSTLNISLPQSEESNQE